jgi:hypothetical protein
MKKIFTNKTFWVVGLLAVIFVVVATKTDYEDRPYIA